MKEKPMTERSADFGFEKVTPAEKTRRVTEVFSSVVNEYDLMNDIMSFGLHRLWKRQAVYLCNIRKNYRVLDLAGGTGDLASLIYEQIGDDGAVTVCDINHDMLQRGRDRFIDNGVIRDVGFVQADAECLPFKDNSFDCITIGFGLRNVTHKKAALHSMYDKLKFGCKVLILEFSKVLIPLLEKFYNQYSFRFIPLFGKAIADDADSYRYLVESIRVHPDQKALATMMQQVGFENVQYHNLSGGIVAIHQGYKL